LTLFLASLLAYVGAGCKKNSPAEIDVEVHLLLPETADTSFYNIRQEDGKVKLLRPTKLSIEGQDFPAETKDAKRDQTVKIKLPGDKKLVSIVYSYWSQSYTNRVRSKTVPFEKGKSLHVDLTKEDSANPDKILPVYYPTPHSLLKPMCELGKVGKNDVVYDIGCGDGRLVIAAVKDFGAKKGVGIDISEPLIAECKENAKKAGVADKTEFRVQDALKITDLSEASVVMIYLGEDLNMKIRPVLQKTLKPGARVVSHRFLMEDWKPDKTLKFTAKKDEGDDDQYELHLWTIKAQKPKVQSRYPILNPPWDFADLGVEVKPPFWTSVTVAADEEATEIQLWLPDTSDTSGYEDRITTLKIDGKLIKEIDERKRIIEVQPAKGKKTITIVYSYWPKSYTNRIRTKVVAVEKGKRVNVDMRKEDPSNPDKILPVYYPTPHSLMKPMCDLAKVGKDDVVYDIGCGDGRLVIAAVKKFGAKKGVGIDINEKLIEECKENAKKAGVADKTVFLVQDALKIKDFSEATVVMLYVGEDLNLKLRPVLKKTLKPSARIVSHRFLMGDWKTDKTLNITAKRDEGDDDEYALHLWTIKKKKEK
jgi:cyclopropane fatty-acyl-phospholipid synthase-like methyltransferase